MNPDTQLQGSYPDDVRAALMDLILCSAFRALDIENVFHAVGKHIDNTRLVVDTASRHGLHTNDILVLIAPVRRHKISFDELIDDLDKPSPQFHNPFINNSQPWRKNHKR
jgi:hypothetical protein